MRVILIISKKYGPKECFIDDEDYDKIKDFIWCVGPNRGTFYAMSRLIVGNNKYKTIRMHQLLLDGKPIDHVDGNGLNNQKSNLRSATHQQNNFNVGITKRNKTGYKGVYKSVYSFVATIRVNGKLIHGGSFKNAIDAAKKYNELAKEYHGKFAWLNPI